MARSTFVPSQSSLKFSRRCAPRSRRPRAVSADLDYQTVVEAAEKGVVKLVLGAAAFQWIGMGVLVLSAWVREPQMREPVQWNVIFDSLTQGGGVEAVSPEKARQLLQNPFSGAILLDIRAEGETERAPISAATHIPLYRPLSGSDIFTNAKRVVFFWNGKAGTELDPDWIRNVQDVVPKNKTLVVMCNQGGSLASKPGAPTGFASRSLKAVYFLKEAGYSKVSYLEGGAPQYLKNISKTSRQ
eukprot:CAMPEP_0198219098 /NCGR_PEP_ID=MMETSP1445-20131203/72543_1 /TAXON_ID=36898 /ORGANISM="Pyramimonas sp., Strain CCMP2087" /LENGTH=242 /DNA_ID=CAMNT_0043896397 /DNA_START=193 /DNA_END=921 /DNA_ORIENTATION=+